MTAGMNPIAEEDVRIVPANEASQEERTAMLEVQTACGDPDAADTSGLVAYVDGEPAGWVAVEPRTEFPKLRTSRVPWFARERGARALEAYPMITHPGKEITWGETHVGTRQVFEHAGFKEITHPTPRRVVMRIDLGPARRQP
jgi:hypothetical protein